MDMQNKVVYMIQTHPCNWIITNSKGIILMEDIKLGLKAEAEAFIKSYVSSFQDWTYELKPLEDK